MEKYYKRVYATQQIYNGRTFRSTMEADFAKFLSGVAIWYKGANYYHAPLDWEYEAHEFELIPQEDWLDPTERDTTLKRLVRNKKHTLQRVIYTPDFYLPKYDLFVEVKGFGFFNDLFKLRLRLFRHFYPNKKLWIVQHHEEFLKLDEVIANTQIKDLTE